MVTKNIPVGVRRCEGSSQQPAVELASTVEALAQALRSRDQAMAVVAHDLRNPIEVIAVSASVLLATLQEPEARRHVKRIAHVTERAAAIVNDLVDRVSIEPGRLSVLKRSMDLATTIRAVAEAQTAVADRHGIGISIDVPPDLALQADRERLEEVLENLVGNALKFTPPRGHINIGAMSQRAHVLVWVKDTGCGIPAENLPRLFEKAWADLAEPRRASGLGLYICKTIVEAHDGRIWVDSAVGRGTTVFFTLPYGPRSSPEQH